LRAGIFSIRAATVAGLGNSILPGPPKNFRRAFGISTTASSLSSIVLSLLAPFASAQAPDPEKAKGDAVIRKHEIRRFSDRRWAAMAPELSLKAWNSRAGKDFSTFSFRESKSDV
jgi:hypothetical protein